MEVYGFALRRHGARRGAKARRLPESVTAHQPGASSIKIATARKNLSGPVSVPVKSPEGANTFGTGSLIDLKPKTAQQ
jgi:hypothetical protein